MHILVQFYYEENSQKILPPEPFLGSNMHQIVCRLGLRPRRAAPDTPLGSSAHSAPQIPSWFGEWAPGEGDEMVGEWREVGRERRRGGEWER